MKSTGIKKAGLGLGYSAIAATVITVSSLLGGLFNGAEARGLGLQVFHYAACMEAANEAELFCLRRDAHINDSYMLQGDLDGLLRHCLYVQQEVLQRCLSGESYDWQDIYEDY